MVTKLKSFFSRLFYRSLDLIEKVGNALPHPATLFAIFAFLVIVASGIFARFDLAVSHPATGEEIHPVSLFSIEGFHRIILAMVDNFTGFAPLGTVLVAMLGIGLAESTGFISAGLKLLVLSAPARLLTFVIVVAGVLSNIASCIKAIEKGAKVEEHLGSIMNALLSSKADIEDVALELRDLKSTIIIDPYRLEEVEERLQLMNKLKKKYGPSVNDILDFKEKLHGMIDNLDQKRDELKKLNKSIKEIERAVRSNMTILSKKRKSVAKAFEESVKNELNLLDMKDTRFEVRFHDGDMRRDDRSPENTNILKVDGYDRVEFMLSPNIGEELKPLSRIASGGELSRIMLALKTILARTASVESIIFDEVDSGIGGATAEVLGDKLRSLAEYHQILCITHLPQIACKGDNHFRVTKKIVEKRTQTIISELDSEERVKEIARLLGGKVISKQALAHAKEMLEG